MRNISLDIYIPKEHQDQPLGQIIKRIGEEIREAENNTGTIIAEGKCHCGEGYEIGLWVIKE